MLSGFAGSFATLFAARASVGVGEAAYVTIVPSLLADYFPRRQRGRVMAIFFCAIPVGSALGYVIGGLIDVHFGWRMAFFVGGRAGSHSRGAVPGIARSAARLPGHAGGPWRRGRDRRAIEAAGRGSLPAIAAQQAVRAHHTGLCRLHLCAGRTRVLDARVSRAGARHTAQPGHGELWRDRRDHRLHRHLRRRLAGRPLRPAFEAGASVDIRDGDLDRRAFRLVGFDHGVDFAVPGVHDRRAVVHVLVDGTRSTPRS